MVEKDWQEDRVLAEQVIWDAGPGRNLGSLRGPYSQWLALKQLDDAKSRFDMKDRMAVFDAIYLCALYGLVIPEWAEHAFDRGYRKVADFQSDSWDDAFGRPYPKNFKLKQARARHLLEPKILEEVSKATKDGAPLHENLWDSIAQRLGISQGLAQKIWLSNDPLAREVIKSRKHRRRTRKKARKS